LPPLLVAGYFSIPRVVHAAQADLAWPLQPPIYARAAVSPA